MKYLLLLLPLFGSQDEGDLQDWVDQLGADYQEDREEAFARLLKAGKKAQTHLIEGVEHTDYRVRGSCITLLTQLKSSAALEPVAAVFRNPGEDPEVQRKAFAYLVAMEKESEEILIEALDRPESEFRLGALQALRKLKSAKSAPKVAEVYDREKVKEVKAAAFECLKNLGKTAQPHLLDLLNSQDSMVREGAIVGLRNINTTQKDAAVVKKIGQLFCTELDRSVLRAAYLFLKGCGAQAAPHFVAGLKAANEDIQKRSLEGLIELRVPGGLESASILFQSTASNPIRLLAKAYMEGLGEASESHFIRALENPKPKVKLLAVDALGRMKSEKPQAVISRMFREEKDPEVHHAAFQYLVRLEGKAEEDLLFALKDPDKKIRLVAIQSVGKIRSENAIPLLISYLGTLDQAVEKAAMDALVRIGQKAVEAVQAEVRAGRVDGRGGELILTLFHHQQVEVLLAKLVSADAGFGYYEGMFAGLRDYGPENALPVLLRIVEDPNHQSRLLEFTGTRDRFNRALRELAIMAIGDLGDKGLIPRLKKALKETTSFGLDDEYGHLIVALYKVGDRDSFRDFVIRLEKEAAEALSDNLKEDGYEKLFYVGLVQNRVGLRKAAEKSYRNLLKLIENEEGPRRPDVYPDTLYNLACLEALQGETAAAVKTLRRAVQAGFKDQGWIEKDGDLNSIRDNAGYRELMAEKALFKAD